MTESDRDWIQGQFDDLRREIVQVQISLATLKVKASFWGAVAGAIPVGIFMFIKWG